MRATETENLLSRILSAGSAFTAIFLLSGSVTDPVNVTKFLALGIVAMCALGGIFTPRLVSRVRSNRSSLFAGCLFLAAVIISCLFSNSPLSQNIYGAYGRNTGALTYIFLLIIFLCATTLRANSSFVLILKALAFAGVANVIYCLWVLVFGDFIGWSNPSGKILGTFGNQDFIAAFLGIFFSVCFAYLISLKKSKVARGLSIAILVTTIYEIESSKAIQGLVVAALGVATVLFFYVRAKYSNRIQTVYLFFASSIALISLLGTLQIGPLTRLLYKTSVSLRGQYWLAAWNTGTSHPAVGVGMDSFGDWYRRVRDAHALVVPGVNTTVNTAHNVFLDMFAFGGWPLFVSYTSLVLVSGYSIIKMLKRSTSFNFVQVSLTTAWLGYQIQSIISINQIGLAIWGWLLGGAVIGYEKATRVEESESEFELKGRKKRNELPPKIVLTTFLLGIVGLLIALPPLTSDSKWRGAQAARSLPATLATMKSSYFNPENSTRYLVNIQTLEASGLFDLSHKYALEAVRWNPDAFELWKVFFLLKNSTPKEKALALQKMKYLDPLNPDVTSIK